MTGKHEEQQIASRHVPRGRNDGIRSVIACPRQTGEDDNGGGSNPYNWQIASFRYASFAMTGQHEEQQIASRHVPRGRNDDIRSVIACPRQTGEDDKRSVALSSEAYRRAIPSFTI